MTNGHWIAYLVMVAVSGLLRGFTGFGFSITAVPLLSLIMPPSQAIPIVVVLQLVLSAAGLREAARLADRRSVAVLAVGAAAGTPLGVLALAHMQPATARLVLTILLVLAIALLGRGFRFARPLPPLRVLLVGLASGLANGTAGLPGPPVIAYYVASPVAPAAARASMMMFFLLTSLFAVASLVPAGLLTQAALAPVMAGLPLMFAGSWIGAALFRRSKPRQYNQVALGVLAAAAAASAARAVSGLVSP